MSRQTLGVTLRLPSRRVVIVIVSLLLAALAARILLDSAGELGEAADALSDIRIGWLLAAIVVELLSYVAFGRAIQRLLSTGERRSVRSLTAAAIVAQAASQCLPGGAATSGVVAFRQVRRLGVSEIPSAAAVTVANLLQAAALPLLALVGAELPGAQQPIPDLRTVCLILIGGIVVIAAVLIIFRARQYPRRSLTWAAVKSEALSFRVRSRFSKTTPSRPEVTLAERLGQFDVGARQVVLAAVLCTIYWVGDALCLAAAFPAVGATIPWRGLLLAYPAAQLVSALPLIPGGLGVVEGSLTAGLVAYGGATSTALAAVLLYRLISFWGLIPVGGLTWLGLRAKYPLAVETPAPAPAVSL